jgi:hypothetical protein
LPVPEALVFEADEFRFTMAAALAPFGLLRDPPTHYRVHEGNLFWERAPAKQEQRKAQVLAELAVALRGSQDWYKRARAGAVPIPSFAKEDAPDRQAVKTAP